MNEYDSNRILDLLTVHNIKKTDQIEDADIILLNTCSIREKAQEKVFSDLGRFRKLKTQNPQLIIGVGGCVASQEGKAILKRAPYVDIIFGPQTIHRLPEMIKAVIKTQVSVIDTTFPEIEKFDCLPPPKIEGSSAFISIMEGCNNFCSYCIVPYTRGREFSRPMDNIIQEACSLAEQNVREITLLGQNANNYKYTMPNNDEAADLAALIREIANIQGLDRIRFMTSHPRAFSNNLFAVYADIPKLANHMHLPVQSGSDQILAAMRRGYTINDFKSIINKLRQIRPNISISSDFIVGFPNETDADFEDTLNLAQEIGFDHSFSFIYSKRPGTTAAKLPDNVPLTIKKQRLATLQSCLSKTEKSISQNMINYLFRHMRFLYFKI